MSKDGKMKLDHQDSKFISSSGFGINDSAVQFDTMYEMQTITQRTMIGNSHTRKATGNPAAQPLI